MRRILILFLVVVFGAAFVAPSCHAAYIEPENSFCIYGVAGMQISFQVGEEMFEYTFGDGATHYSNPYVITSSKISEWYSKNYQAISFYCNNTSAITLTSPDAVISASAPEGASMTEIIIAGDDGSPLALVTKLLALKRMYLFPVGSAPNVAGVTPTPFVNDGSDIVVDDDELKNTIGSVSEFKPFMQFIFTSVIPWAGFAAVIILVFATIKFMLKG